MSKDTKKKVKTALSFVAALCPIIAKFVDDFFPDDESSN